ncbi:MAG: type 4a pilus biogenesis protein PilO [Planctomycetota bacterium]|nr:MAG: type 4a pilus biogenesis protein PilO [Planctomycetota bacterium]
MKPVYKKYLTRVALIWAGSFILLCCIYIFVLAPQKKTKNQIGKQLALKKQIYNSALEISKVETKIKLKEQLETLQNKLVDFVIEPENSADLIFDISQIANEKKVDSFSIKPREKHRSSDLLDCEHISENCIDISFKGNYNQFATLLNSLERHRPVIFVDDFVITRSQESYSDHQVNMSLSVFAKQRQDS